MTYPKLTPDPPFYGPPKFSPSGRQIPSDPLPIQAWPTYGKRATRIQNKIKKWLIRHARQEVGEKALTS